MIIVTIWHFVACKPAIKSAARNRKDDAFENETVINSLPYDLQVVLSRNRSGAFLLGIPYTNTTYYSIGVLVLCTEYLYLYQLGRAELYLLMFLWQLVLLNKKRINWDIHGD